MTKTLIGNTVVSLLKIVVSQGQNLFSVESNTMESLTCVLLVILATFVVMIICILTHHWVRTQVFAPRPYVIPFMSQREEEITMSTYAFNDAGQFITLFEKSIFVQKFKF